MLQELLSCGFSKSRIRLNRCEVHVAVQFRCNLHYLLPSTEKDLMDALYSTTCKVADKIMGDDWSLPEY